MSLVQRPQNIELNKTKSKLKQLLKDTARKYIFLELEAFNTVAHEGNIYVPVALLSGCLCNVSPMSQNYFLIILMIILYYVWCIIDTLKLLFIAHVFFV